MEQFEWDDNKNRANIQKHGIDFEDAISIFLEDTLEKEDDRFEYGEARFIAIGLMRSIVVAVVYTMRGDTCRIISARKAKRHERDAYSQAISARPPDWKD